MTKIEHLNLVLKNLGKEKPVVTDYELYRELIRLSDELVKEQGNYVVITAENREVCENISKIKIGTKVYCLDDAISLRTGKHGYINWIDPKTKAVHVDHGHVKVSLKYGDELE
jgi:hypothetical protein